jgi:hypothetical protein
MNFELRFTSAGMFFCPAVFICSIVICTDNVFSVWRAGDLSFFHSFIPSFIYLFIRSFICSFIYSFIHSFIHSSVSRQVYSLFQSECSRECDLSPCSLRFQYPLSFPHHPVAADLFFLVFPSLYLSFCLSSVMSFRCDSIRKM